MRLSFFGAARSVTGSCFLLEAARHRILVDCGMRQERSQTPLNWEPFPVPPSTVDAVLLTHAHVDHCGLLPKLVRDGFRGAIHCTAPTAEIAGIVLMDAARLAIEDLEQKRNRHQRQGRASPHPLTPLYNPSDVAATAPLFSPVPYGRAVTVAPGIEASFHEAGHIFGSSSIMVRVSEGPRQRSIHFSGDVGRWGKPILGDPEPCVEADYVLVESTYGDRLHGSSERIEAMLADAVRWTVEAGGNLLIPSFAIERSQEVLYYLNLLLLRNAIPHVMVFLDSPMATQVTEVFAHHPELFDADMRALIRAGRSPFHFPSLVQTRSVEDSKAINRIRGTAIIIAGSGMCTGGRIKHHLARHVARPESCVLFVGYQAQGTLGREIADGAREVRILGERLPVRARVETVSGFSAHADRDELARWLAGVQKPPRRLFIVHGEYEASQSLRELVRKTRGWDGVIPEPRESVELA